MTDQKIRVLLVDDHSIVRNGVRRMLETAGEIDVTGEAETVSYTHLTLPTNREV